MTQQSVPAAPAPQPAWHGMSPDEVLREQGVDQASGLTSAEVASRRSRYGPNKFAEAPKEPRWRAFLRQYADPMQIVLLVAGGISLFLPNQLATGIVLILLTVFNAFLGLNQEGKAEASVAALQKMMVVRAKARRDGEIVQVAMEDLVPGDIINIEAGDLVPADGRIIRAATLEIDESALTGESAPVPKAIDAVPADAALGDRVDMAFMNTQVTRGAATFVVTSTGMATEVGHISGMLQEQTADVTPLTKQLNRLTSQILLIAGVSLAVSIGLGLYRDQPFDALFLTAVAFAVSAIPTGLPAVVTTILSGGTSTLAKAGAIVKRLRSVETLGSTSAINSDKTGTLTLNQMTAVQMAIVGHRFSITGEGYSTEGHITGEAGTGEVPLDRYLLPMALCADAVAREGELVGDPTEGALVVLASKGGVDPVLTRERYPRIAEVPFDAAYKLMATFHEMTDEAGRPVIRTYVKGAPDQLLARASHAVAPDGSAVPVDQVRDAYMAENERLGSQGLRVMATAQRDFDPSTFQRSDDLLPLIDDLTLLALVGIVDPPRPEAKVAIEKAKAAGIQVRMITGDHAVTAEAIARQLGIEGRAITGAQFTAMNDAEVAEQIDTVGVIARVAPEDKVHLVDVLKCKGHIVAMTGDGVNDAPALKKADIGVAMGLSGTDVAREAADMVLADDNFASIVNAVEEGRAVHANIRRFAIYVFNSNMAEAVPFVAMLFSRGAIPLPLTVMQVLSIDLGTDMVPAIGLGAELPEKEVMDQPPRPRGDPLLNRNVLVRALLWYGLIEAVVAMSAYFFLNWLHGWPKVPLAAEGTLVYRMATTMTLAGVVTAQVGAVFACRSDRVSILTVGFFSNRLVLLGVAVELVLLGLIVYVPFLQWIFHTAPLGLFEWGYVLAWAPAILLADEGRKVIMRKRERAIPSPGGPS